MATYLHTCYRIGDIDRSVAFYEKLGFEEMRRMPIGEEAINVFMGLPGDEPRLELTYNHGVAEYDLGTGYNHIAVGVDDLDGTLERLAAEGVSEGDGVFVLGFPMGDVGGERNHAIVRGGTIARVRDALAGTTDTMLLDCFVFPGNSGGPVVLRPERTTIEGTPSPQRALLLGLVKSYVPYRDVATSAQTGRARIVFEENTGLCSATLIDVVADLARRHADGSA